MATMVFAIAIVGFTVGKEVAQLAHIHDHILNKGGDEHDNPGS